MNTALLRKTTIGALGPEFRALTLSGNEITDASRALGTAGDGLLNDSSFGIWPAATNLCTNGGFESNTTGWTTGGTNTIASSAAQFKFGAKSGLATYADNATLADYAATITNVAHTVSVWVYIPTAYDGAGIELRQLNYTVAASAANASMATRDAWQKVTLTFTPGVDVIGNIQVNNTGAAPTAGRFIYIDGLQIETHSTGTATPYIETNGGTATRTAARVQAPATLINATQGWVAMRLRFGTAGVPPGGASRFFEWGSFGANWLALYANISSATVGRGTTSMLAGPALTWGVGTFVTIVAAWSAAELKCSVNGSVFSTGANTNAPAMTDTTMDIGSTGTTDFFHGDVLWFACGSGTLSNGDAAAIHAFGNSDRGLSAFPGNATGFWSAKNGVMELRA